ncbi:hypothetical protein SZN_21581 [Streptomyces zinciresistens K42]|uniref:Acyltransferase n=1 Tax=Streptomyces zinciresistens K42 TaxID=700597 RepID=G2GFN2_9ACTN|nr:acyltransferase domain-containing protein [Streptomyces zinciresistens]EGX57688.1 hypothetical protein SZN_21581 [Streptomyces zinciresistens K42]
MTRPPADPGVRAWLDALRPAPDTAAHPAPEAAPEAAPDSLETPSADEARRRMDLLDVPAEDRERVLATLPDPVGDPELWRALGHCHRALFAPSAPAPRDTHWPDAPVALGAAGRYFYVHLCLLALPSALERQRRLGIPAEVVAATFADVGAKLLTYRRAHGTGGFDRQRWVIRHFRGTLYRLGHLQFERTTLDARALGGPPGPGGPADGEQVLDVHIPADGRLTPDRCDQSLRAAPAFFARHFPGEPVRFAICSSWLLDGQLADHLPRDANILRFQRRFTRFGDRPAGDDDILEFVFHTPPGTADLNRLPRDTTLRRAIVDHLRAGRHWRAPHGWLRLPETT